MDKLEIENARNALVEASNIAYNMKQGIDKSYRTPEEEFSRILDRLDKTVLPFFSELQTWLNQNDRSKHQ